MREINSKQLKFFCLATEDEILDWANRHGWAIVPLTDKKQVCYWLEHSSPHEPPDVMGLAHMDTVHNKKLYYLNVNTPKGQYHMCPTLDDRLGVYTLLYHLPHHYGIRTQVLLTLDEERCNSSAHLFDEGSFPLNWVYSFDREGSDVVTYNMESEDWLDALRGVGFKLGWGTYSDMAELDRLGICGVNVGTGLCNGHGYTANMFEKAYVKQVEKFVLLYHMNRGVMYGCDSVASKPVRFGMDEEVGGQLGSEWDVADTREWDDGAFQQEEQDRYFPDALTVGLR
ncbi:MAG: hypothetical protein WC822_01390 [Candidatus Paceibacterota bacterium]|jgi:hypothetical protein